MLACMRENAVLIEAIAVVALVVVTLLYVISAHKMAKTMEREQKTKQMPILYPNYRNIINIGEGIAKDIRVLINGQPRERTKRSPLFPANIYNRICDAKMFKGTINVEEGFPGEWQKGDQIILDYKDVSGNKYKTEYGINDRNEVDFDSIQFEPRD